MPKKKHKQKPPKQFRPYPPIEQWMEEHDIHNLNYVLNSAVANMAGSPQGIVDQYRRGKGIDT